MGHGTTKINFRRKLSDGTYIDAPLTIDNQLREILDKAKKRNEHNWDYLSIVAGIPGAGKSQFAKNTLAPYCCSWFSAKYIAFSGDEFIDITTRCPDYSAVVLDESFAPLNTRLTYHPEFQRIVNHIQLIRQKRLFVFICLPNYFDLAKNIAIFRSSHLFVPYENKEGRRGDFAAFGRNEKRELYVLGAKFMNYNARDSNFIGRFFKNTLVIDEDEYTRKKKEHFMKQNKKLSLKDRPAFDKDVILYEIYLAFHNHYHITQRKFADVIKINRSYLGYVLNKMKNLDKTGDDRLTDRNLGLFYNFNNTSNKKTLVEEEKEKKNG